MAVGDFVINTPINVTGHRWVYTGTAEISNTATAFDMFPGRYIDSLVIQGADDAGAVQQTLNQDASSNTDNGNCVLQSSLEPVNTYNWTAVVI